MNYFKRLETTVIAVIILVLGLAYGLLNNQAQAPDMADSAQQNAQATTPPPASIASMDLASTGTLSYMGQDGKTALDVLKSQYEVETQSFGDVGEFVSSINGVKPDSAHFWAFYVDGEIAQVGAGSYVTKSSETIQWKLEEIK
jgi:hypothetical protein